MPTIFIPTLLAPLAGGKTSLKVEGATVGRAIDELERACPGLKDRLVEGVRLRPGVQVAVDGRITPLGLLARVSAESEIHFVAAIGGG